jgi:2-polyprenyl-6-methoxyphenol hydroxylase-like FAD-dependent oxidoreductase
MGVDGVAYDATGDDPFVLVVGAGPTGLLLAAELQRRAVPCRVIDANPGPLHWDRATVVHPRSLEVFEGLGLADRFLDAGTPQRGARIHSGGAVLGAFDLSTSGSSYPFNLGVSEEVTESILAAYLHGIGGVVTRGARLVGLTPGSAGVLAEIEHDGDRSVLTPAWVVGCDGIHSPTRDACGIELVGHDIDAPWAVFDATLDGWTDVYDLTFVYLELVPVILTALPDRRWRVYLRPSGPDSDLVADAAATLRDYYPDASFTDVEHPTRFHCHSKVATAFRSGRMLLAGDAAHLCSPAQGHGMNTGLQDAANLGWKLALVHQGAAAPELLDSYEIERRPAATRVADTGDEFEHAQTAVDPTDRAARDDAFRTTLGDPATRHHEIVAEAELDIEYSGSPIVRGPTESLLGPGMRLPDTIPVWTDGVEGRLHTLTHRTGHTVLALAGRAADPTARRDLVDGARASVAASPRLDALVVLADDTGPGTDVVRIDEAALAGLGVGGLTLLAVRPDGYVGLRADTDHLAALARYDDGIRTGRA